jgi:hypothetical protein
MTDKTLWLVTGSESNLLNHARAIGAKAVAVRTDNYWLPEAIRRLQGAGLKVYGWRWPGVLPSSDPPNYYAPEQAAFVVQTLVPAGLDGYIADIESDGPKHPGRDWNDRSLAALATSFAKEIRDAGRAQSPNFLFGLTSGFDFPTAYPHIPWDAFLALSDAVYPQVYWRGDGGAIQAGGTPQSAWNRSLRSWKTLGLDETRIVPIVGQIEHVTPQSLGDFRAVMLTNAITELHFYCDVDGIAPAIYTAMGAL